MKIAIAQIRYNWSDPLIKNLRKAIGLIERSGRSGAEVLCLSEYFLGKDAVLGHPSRGEKTDAALGSIAEKAKESDVTVICGAMRDSRQGQRKHFVTSPVINREGKIVKKLDKVALYPHEMEWAQPGSSAETAEIDGFNVGVLAGFDIFFSPSIQALRKKGVDLLFYQLAANSRPLLETEQAAAIARCQELMAPVVAVGQLGESLKRKLLGGSVVCVPQTVRFNSTVSAGGVRITKRFGGDERFDMIDLDLQALGQQRKKFTFYET